MLKKGLRNQYTKLRLSNDESALDSASLAIASLLLKLPIWEFTYYHLFLPITAKREVDTSYILTILQGKDKEVVLPRVSGNNQLQHILLTDATRIVPNKWNIPEPVNGLEVPVNLIDVVFVPLLAFDKKGHRVGYGKGFYDVFLSTCRADTIKVGLSEFDPVEVITDIEATDIPLDYGVTPTKIYDFSS